MTTGWKYIDDLGNEYRSQRLVVLAMMERPEMTVTFSELDMGGTHLTDITERIREVVKREKVD